MIHTSTAKYITFLQNVKRKYFISLQINCNTEISDYTWAKML